MRVKRCLLARPRSNDDEGPEQSGLNIMKPNVAVYERTATKSQTKLQPVLANVVRLERLLTPSQAARELCVSDKQLRALTRAGHIRYINVGLGEKRETRRYDLADLQAFLEERAHRCQFIGDRARRSIATTFNIVGSIFGLDGLHDKARSRSLRKGAPARAEN
ncbi:helix-turn-helix domain-containing protein [Chelativorans salis]|uniref:Helix-turn-helix domain-containing protein n=1 Tax=Chelativorans salis TaxID=2978478 RepID=A0ABT2LQI9_9HYPH|nr:helix-turn-helix domain-containing protein [Chelativorans sp. EGI FJ00035]MCT7375898.1 helix-turn-helix domain-containing protein [Chelativorans sp. EGI FJ00035]